MVGEAGGGIGMGNTCKPMAVSFQCMTKSTTKKKKKDSGWVQSASRDVLGYWFVGNSSLFHLHLYGSEHKQTKADKMALCWR